MSTFRPKRSLGQNFLIDPNYRRKIVDAAQKIPEHQTILEIGPGRGALTELLYDQAQAMILVEKDRDLAQALRARFADGNKVQVVTDDFLECDLEFLPKDQKTLVVANLPYNVSSQILIRLLENRKKFSALILMFQKEVALRCVGKPGTADYGPLALWSEIFTTAEKIFDVPPAAFRPQPKVWSSVVRFVPKHDVAEDALPFLAFARTVFSLRRKTLNRVLKDKFDFAIEKTELSAFASHRAEDMTLAELLSVYRLVKI